MPELPPSFTALLKDFAPPNALNVEAVLLNPQVVVDSLPVGLLYEGINDFGDIILHAVLGQVPSERAEAAFRLMLEGNHLWAATGGATLGLLDDGTATICHRTLLAQMNADALADTLELSAAQARNWMLLIVTPDAPVDEDA